MKKEAKQKMFVLFVLFMFLGSSAAFALLSAFVPSQEPRVQLVYEGPLSNAEEAQFFQQNKIILKFFYSDDCEACDDASLLVDDLFQRMKGNMVVERINTFDFPDEASRLGISEVPIFYFRGKTEKKLLGDATYDELLNTACDLFFEPKEDVCLS
ncbi:MAG: thioredoxin domain-containing protein [Candidatus Aenigmatarchaeota archaeon]